MNKFDNQKLKQLCEDTELRLDVSTAVGECREYLYRHKDTITSKLDAAERLAKAAHARLDVETQETYIELEDAVKEWDKTK